MQKQCIFQSFSSVTVLNHVCVAGKIVECVRKQQDLFDIIHAHPIQYTLVRVFAGIHFAKMMTDFVFEYEEAFHDDATNLLRATCELERNRICGRCPSQEKSIGCETDISVVRKLPESYPKTARELSESCLKVTQKLPKGCPQVSQK